MNGSEVIHQALAMSWTTMGFFVAEVFIDLPGATLPTALIALVVTTSYERASMLTRAIGHGVDVGCGVGVIRGS